MNTITHALLPLIAAKLCDCLWRAKLKRENIFSLKQLIVIGVLGAAPDLINPHLTIEGRYASWSHSLWFWLLLTIGLYIFSRMKGEVLPVFMVGWLSAGYLLHLVCDIISGGISWGFPMTRSVVGAFYVNPVWWFPLDVFLLLFAYGLFRLVPKMGRLKNEGE